MASTPNSSNPWFAVSMGLLGLIIGYSLSSGLGQVPKLPGGGGAAPSPTAAVPTPPAPPAPTNDTPADADDDIVMGDEDATVTLIEFSDIQCPFCRRFWRDSLPQIKENYIETGKVKHVFRDFPLSFHPGALPAAMAVECAADQDGDLAWELKDVIFAEQDKQGQGTVQFTADDIKKWAAGVSGLNVAKLTSCMDANTHKAEIDADMADGSASGIDGTPGFWIIGPDGKSQKVSGAYPYETFKAAFDAMLD